MDRDVFTQRTVEECTFRASDETELFYRHWPVVAGRPRGAVVLLHRGHEHSGRMAFLVEELGLADFAFFAWDARGHGRSPGARGDSPSFGTTVRDLHSFVEHIRAMHGHATRDIVLVAQSVGAVVAAAWVHDYAPRIRGMVLASPAFRVKLYVPFARAGLGLMRAMRGNFFVNSYVKAKFLTHDEARIASYDTDPLIARAISVNVLLGLYEAAARVVNDAAAIVTPTQVLISGSDWVVDPRPQHEFFERLGAAVKEKHVFAGFYHDTLGERDRHLAIAKARAFILARFDEPATQPDLRDADRESISREAFDALSRPLAPLSPTGLYWGATRLLMRTAGRLSRGVRLGLTTGFDSGSTLDYVYENRPQGTTPLGRFIDRIYLESPGWRAIRARKSHLEELIVNAIARLRAVWLPVHVMDIAAGHGRYVLEAFEPPGVPRPDSILLRDYSALNVERGTALIRDKGLEGIARFVKGDAFDAESLAATTPRPTLAIVSGLYELFPDNALVRRSLAGLAAAIPPGGYLVYTCQPWHPQLELIARALTSHRNGVPWVMRCRTQAEMDQLVAAAGFRKVEQRTDDQGIATVSLAVRR